VDDRRHAIALFRYSLVREAADPALTTRQRGRLVRQLAQRDHLGPDGSRVRVSRNTLDRWIRAWRHGGFEALLPADRSTAQLRSPLELLELAASLKREAPMRTSAQITQILRASHPDQPQIPSPATIRRYFHRIGLHLGVEERPQVFGRFEAAAPNLLWTGDALHGPTVDLLAPPAKQRVVDRDLKRRPGGQQPLHDQPGQHQSERVGRPPVDREEPVHTVMRHHRLQPGAQQHPTHRARPRLRDHPDHQQREGGK
jgi:transposase